MVHLLTRLQIAKTRWKLTRFARVCNAFSLRCACNVKRGPDCTKYGIETKFMYNILNSVTVRTYNFDAVTEIPCTCPGNQLLCILLYKLWEFTVHYDCTSSVIEFSLSASTLCSFQSADFCGNKLDIGWCLTPAPPPPPPSPHPLPVFDLHRHKRIEYLTKNHVMFHLLTC